MPANSGRDKSLDVDPGRTALEMTFERQTEQTQLLGGKLGRSDVERSDVLLKVADVSVEEEFETEQVPETKTMPKYIMRPDSQFRRIWMQIQLVIALYIIWVTPVRVGFDMQAQGFWFWMEGVINLFFWTDLVMNFFVAYESPITGELVTDHKKIAIRYLKGWFVVDLLATFPSDYIVKGIQGTWGCSIVDNCYYTQANGTNVVLIALLRVMRIFRIFWIFKNFKILSADTVLGRLQYELMGWYWLVSVAELLIVLVFLGHCAGCFMYMFGGSVYWRTSDESHLIDLGILRTWVLEKFGGYYTVQIPDTIQGSNSTLNTSQIAPAGPGQYYYCPDYYLIVSCPTCQGPPYRCQGQFGFAYRYITSLYWAYTTMTTVGYGDIVGFIIAEKIWCMVTMVVGGFFLSFCFGRMANIVGKLDAEKSARNEQMEQVTRFLKDVDLPKPLSRKIIDFFSASVKDVKPYDRDAVITQLPFELRSKIMQHVYLPTIKAVPVLKRFAEDELFLTDLCTRLHPYRCSAETFVYQKGEDHCDMYILLRGEMHVLDSDRRSYLFKIPEGTVFGESGPLRKIEGYGRARRQENVFCQTECDMLRITSEDVTVMCEHYPQLYKDLHKLDKSRQNRYKIVYGADSSLSQSPFNQPVGPSQPSSTSDNSAASHGGFFHTQQQAGGLTSLPASGLSQTHPRMPTLVDRNPLAGGGEMSIAPTMESYPGDLEDNNLKDVLLGAEMAALKQQVDSRQAEVMQQLEEQKKMLMLLVAKLSTFSSLGMTSSSNNGNGGIMIDFASMPSSEPTMDSWLKGVK